MQRYTWIPPEQGYNSVSVIEHNEDYAKGKILRHVRSRVDEHKMNACEYYALSEDGEFAFDKHRLVVSDPGEVYEHMRA